MSIDWGQKILILFGKLRFFTSSGATGTEKEARINIGGKSYRIASDDNALARIGSYFEPKMAKLFGILASESEVILDIGANIGCTALLFGDLAQKVYAFEPSPSTFYFLTQNIARSRQKNITPYNWGLGAQAGECALTFAPSNRAGAFVSERTPASLGHITETIEIRPLDEVVQSLDLKTIDLIKIDVEGFEPQVIAGGKETLLRYQPIVVLELNHWCLNAFQRTSVPDFFDLLRSVFPILFAVEGSHYLDLHNDSESYTAMYYNILHMKFANIVAAFDEQQVSRFKENYKQGFTPSRSYFWLKSQLKKVF